tara:strand:- start:2072 stop:2770 length:699 start_codon:yes stop_codon:yes gene_type:complete
LIIGNGLIGNAFKKYFKDDNDVLIFASGVSDSKNKDRSDYKREERLLKSYLDQNNDYDLFVYFSTISVEDISMQKREYILHKLKMEAVIRESKNSIIFRLGQIASRGKGNLNNLLNYLVRSIKNQDQIEVWLGSYRNILDIDDIVKIIVYIISNNLFTGEIVNIVNPKSHRIEQIISILEEVLLLKGDYSYIEKGVKYVASAEKIIPLINDLGMLFNDQYLHKVFKKYYHDF